MGAKDIAPWLAIAAVFASIVGTWSVMGERISNLQVTATQHTGQIATQKEETDKLKGDSTVKIELNRLSDKVENLSENIKELKSRRR